MTSLNRFTPLWLGLLAALLYAPTLQFGFVNYDDPWLLQNNTILHQFSFEQLRAIWSDFSTGQRIALGREYLPVRDTSAMLDFALWGDWIGGHHLTNVLLYALFCGLLYLVLSWWLQRRELALITCLLFIVHPFHVEAVAWLSERKGLLAACWICLSLLAFYRFAQASQKRWLLVSTACMALAIWSKAVATMGVPFLTALLWLFPPQKEHPQSAPTNPDDEGHAKESVNCEKESAEAPPLDRRAWFGWCTLAFVSVLAFVPVWWTGQQMQMLVENQGSVFWKMAQVHGMYLARLFWLGEYAIWYPIAQNQWSLWMQSLGIGGALLIVVVAFAGAWKRGPWRLWSLAAWCWLLFLFPVSGLLFQLQNAMADRYMLMPSIGGMLAIAALSTSLPTPRLRWGLIIGLTCLTAILTLRQSQTWSSSAAMYSQVLQLDPSNVNAQSQLIQLARKTGQTERAWKLLQTSLRQRPHHPKIALQHALLLLRKRQLSRSIEVLRASAKRHKDAKIRANMALLLLRMRKPKEALRWAREAVQHKPQIPHSQRVLGVVALQNGRPQEALKAFKQALLYQPNHPQNHVNVAAAYQRLGLPDKIPYHMEKAKELHRRRRR